VRVSIQGNSLSLKHTDSLNTFFRCLHRSNFNNHSADRGKQFCRRTKFALTWAKPQDGWSRSWLSNCECVLNVAGRVARAAYIRHGKLRGGIRGRETVISCAATSDRNVGEHATPQQDRMIVALAPKCCVLCVLCASLNQ